MGDTRTWQFSYIHLMIKLGNDYSWASLYSWQIKKIELFWLTQPLLCRRALNIAGRVVFLAQWEAPRRYSDQSEGPAAPAGPIRGRPWGCSGNCRNSWIPIYKRSAVGKLEHLKIIGFPPLSWSYHKSALNWWKIANIHKYEYSYDWTHHWNGFLRRGSFS